VSDHFLEQRISDQKIKGMVKKSFLFTGCSLIGIGSSSSVLADVFVMLILLIYINKRFRHVLFPMDAGNRAKEDHRR